MSAQSLNNYTGSPATCTSSKRTPRRRPRRSATVTSRPPAPMPAAEPERLMTVSAFLVGRAVLRGLVPPGVQLAGRALHSPGPRHTSQGRRFLSGQCHPLSTFGRFRGPLWRFCEAVFTLDPSKSGIPRRGRSDATNSPQICQLQATGVRRPGRPRRSPPSGAAGQALDENVGTARGVKRARDVGVSVGGRPRGPSIQIRGSIPLPIHHKPDSGRPRRPGPAPIRASEGLRAPVAMVVSPRPER